MKNKATKRKINLRRKTKRNKRKILRRGGVRPSNIPSNIYRITEEQKNFLHH